jgi:aminoglycoside 3-N-acetyltransferase
MFTRKDILEQLEEIGAPRDKIVIMHTSLRAIGEVEGGAKGLLDVLIKYFTKDGGLFCLPTHTWHNYGNPITLDLSSSDSCLGAFPIIATEDGRGLRTVNPTHSIIIFGDRDRALDFASNEANVTSPTAPDGCYGKLRDLDGSILLVGVGQEKNTYIHAVEEMLNVPYRLTAEFQNFGVKTEADEIFTHKMRWLDETKYGDVSLRFPKFDIPFRYHKIIKDGFIGNAPTQLCDARDIYRVLKKLYNNPDGKDPLADEKPIPPKWYI